MFKNCFDDPRSIAEVLADRTHSSVVHVIGRKIVLYRPAKEEKNRKINKWDGAGSHGAAPFRLRQEVFRTCQITG